MPRTPDRTPGVSDEEGIVFSDESVDPTQVGEIRNNAGALKAQDAIGVFNLRQGTADLDSILTDDILGSVLVDDATGNVLVNL